MYMKNDDQRRNTMANEVEVKLEVSAEGKAVSTYGKLTTLDITFMALVGVVFGTLFAFTAPLNHAITAALGPWADGLIGYYFTPQCMAAYIVRKPGAYFITSLLNMMSQAMAGNPAGFAPLFGWGVVGGAAGESIMWLVCRYKTVNFWTLWLTVAFNLLCNWPISAYFYGWGTAGVWNNLLGTLTNMVTSGIESSLIAIGIALLLKRSGLLAGYKISKQT
jgi:energy-coupling factor transport system substrate-specific component